MCPANIGVHVRGLGSFAASQAGVEDGHDLIQRRPGDYGCVLIEPHENMKVLNPVHVRLQLLVEDGTIQGVCFEEVYAGLDCGLILSLLFLSLSQRQFCLPFGLLPVMADQPSNSTGNAAE